MGCDHSDYITLDPPVYISPLGYVSRSCRDCGKMIVDDTASRDTLPPADYGVTCVDCNEFAPHAERVSEFKCWQCTAYPHWRSVADD